ncbi:DUF2393 family protein [Helicobacter sp. 13S00477-4]|uniref:DUF2393 family protein n=1 Tax=Helicobacter sp. 13S00477-4 TaxID=1905759 RepID=UPI000BA6D32B|nr:DUF2393 family protein [Helicobacter sp. 13S00477-4]PAF52272.1 hypothetical protein BKH44_02900 [Helicobacter sp. 13S00477-4]
MIEEIKDLLLMVFYRLSYIEIGLFLFIFIIFMLIFGLGLVFYTKKILSSILFLLAFVVLFSPPFVIRYLMQEKLYKVEVSYNRASPLEYTDSFFIDMDIKNIGKLDIHKCFVKVNVLRSGDRLAVVLRNLFFAEKSFLRSISSVIKPNQSEHFVIVIDDYHYRHQPYKVYLNCY